MTKKIAMSDLALTPTAKQEQHNQIERDCVQDKEEYTFVKFNELLTFGVTSFNHSLAWSS